MNWNLSGYFTGRRSDSDFPGTGVYQQSGVRAIRPREFLQAAHGFSFYGRIANLANKQYQEVLGYPALGREFRIGVKYTTRHE